MKKTYKKPVIRKVKLVPSEAVLAACKTQAVSGPDVTGCQPVSHVCAFVGS